MKKIKNKVIQGNSLEVLKTFEDNSIDTIITDPPYGLSFMGKKWDYDVPSIKLWKECLRVLKPGGTALIFAGSRTQHRMAVNVEDAGFILKDTIMWLYGSGFPKATDISKQLDKGYERKVIGIDKDFERRNPNNTGCNTLHNIDKDGIIQNKNKIAGQITESTTPEAKQWNGWKSHGLKPAYEPILVAQKPNEGNYAQNALKWGVSGLNIDGGRIGKGAKKWSEPRGGIFHPSKKNDAKLENNPQGRFPSNIILDEEAGKMLDEQSGELKSGVLKSDCYINDRDNKSIFAGGGKFEHKGYKSDRGGASRFFYCAKASKSERNAGCEEFDIPEYRWNNGGEMKQIKGQKGNFHPTVKPLKLMEYLCTLTKTPTGGIVLDPFAGSCTTAVACINTDRDFIMIERESEYVKIGQARIDFALKERSNKLF